ncbi:hypothetical protein KOR42_05780 [Thalassoglobus neptunius]|uniref:Uncharacterized protein n=1 Tax=Thalassoglobus neptunius TaxID=1938619 RepID=A0A5C5X322_9PLAN|nr:hypothetical protein [Thalassoglobus neptunius]TWT57220.1 hypothetical protein KOR42_05780 [Thalassoglobus neptunius]
MKALTILQPKLAAKFTEQSEVSFPATIGTLYRGPIAVSTATHIIATALVADCVTRDDGRFLWNITDIRSIPEPFPCGQQPNLWEFDTSSPEAIDALAF